jgi:prepilin-type processing-associated H-X9-DG protein
VSADEVKSPSSVILAAEWMNNWQLVSGVNRNGDGQTLVCKSHRPIHGFYGSSGELDMETVPMFRDSAIRRVHKGMVNPHPQPGGATQTRLDWIGRNHNGRKDTNFLYCDGHVELKVIEATVPDVHDGGKGEWGEIFYSLEQGDQIDD